MLIHLDAILMEEERRTDKFTLLFILIFAEGADQRLVYFQTERAFFFSCRWDVLRLGILDKIVIFIWLRSRWIWLSHDFLDPIAWVIIISRTTL